jgi:hypothetical protein
VKILAVVLLAVSMVLSGVLVFRAGRDAGQGRLTEVLVHEDRCVDLLRQCAELLEDGSSDTDTLDGGTVEYL